MQEIMENSYQKVSIFQEKDVIFKNLRWKLLES